MQRWTGTVVILGVGLLAATACGSSSKPAAGTGSTVASAAAPQPDGDITVYSGQHEQTVGALVTAFEAEAHIKVKVRSDDEARLANQLLQEGSDTPADVFFAENPPALNVLDEKHLLARRPPPRSPRSTPQYSPTSGDWVGVSARSVALGLQHRPGAGGGAADVDPRPRQAASGRARSGSPPARPTSSRSSPRSSSRTAPTRRRAWLSGLKANAKIYDDNEALVAAVDRGEVETGILDHYYWYRLRDEVGAGKVALRAALLRGRRSRCRSSTCRAPGQLASSKHPKSAQAFLAFLVGQTGADRSSPPARATSTRSARGVQTTKVDRARSSAFGTSPMTIADLGDGKQALAAAAAGRSALVALSVGLDAAAGSAQRPAGAAARRRRG